MKIVILPLKNLMQFFDEELKIAEYKIGLFGIGVDSGHTAGILPDSEAVNCQELVCSYDTPVFFSHYYYT